VLTDEGPTEYDSFYEAQEKLTLRPRGDHRPGGHRRLPGGRRLPSALQGAVQHDAGRGDRRDQAVRPAGRGGAGFPTGQKWEFAAGYKSPDGVKYFICNGDEGDPGAFMDCSALEGEPHAVFEGMAIGAYAIGASTGYMYVRAEYPLALRRIKIAMKVAEERGLIGDNIMGSDFSFHIKLKEGAGAFVCGEETALMQSIEGDRGCRACGRPSLRSRDCGSAPPISTTSRDACRGAVDHPERRRGLCRSGIRAVQGHKGVRAGGEGEPYRPGRGAHGDDLREVIYGIGRRGQEQTRPSRRSRWGGRRGAVYRIAGSTLPVDYETINQTGAIVGSGGMIVIDEDNCNRRYGALLPELHPVRSCGKCPPCRIGTKRMLELLNKIHRGPGHAGRPRFLG